MLVKEKKQTVTTFEIALPKHVSIESKEPLPGIMVLNGIEISGYIEQCPFLTYHGWVYQFSINQDGEEKRTFHFVPESAIKLI